MNKKHVLFFISFFLCNNLTTVVACNNGEKPVELKSLSEQIYDGKECCKNLFNRIFHLEKSDNNINLNKPKDLNNPAESNKLKVSNKGSFFDCFDLSKIKFSEICSDYQYLIIGTVIVVAAVVLYNCHHKTDKKSLWLKKMAIKNLIESVLNNEFPSNEERLNKIFGVLLKNGLKNIVVYSDCIFEVDDSVDTFKVEISGHKVIVTCN